MVMFISFNEVLPYIVRQYVSISLFGGNFCSVMMSMRVIPKVTTWIAAIRVVWMG